MKNVTLDDLQVKDGLYCKYVQDDFFLQKTVPFTGEIHEKGYRGSIVDGKKEGYWQLYHWTKPTQLSAHGHYKNGKQEGLWEYFDHRGNVITSGRYKNGLSV